MDTETALFVDSNTYITPLSTGPKLPEIMLSHTLPAA